MAVIRERNKVERRRRIMRAAFELFTERGFDETTTRAIAKRAGVAVGTIFLYAQDKMDLCLLIIHDELETLNDLAEADDQTGPLIVQLTRFFRPRYKFWSKHPKLSRAAAHEMARAREPSEKNIEAERANAQRARTRARLREIVAYSIGTGELRADLDAAAVTRILFDIYLAEHRVWLATEPLRPETGLRKYLELVRIVLSGMKPAVEAGKESKATDQRVSVRPRRKV
ncbi:helix-turn-helix domain containing protein [Roseiarcaceae bacterium H3SJ34-1]|uniref:TetR/AcrR family transcriptional regulator n=1 Tax=Terripilifer ovatus TaxID=3032367 RepID=UPI003AB93C73|nr:helix-turn-helix domain containing protein [Roseiarcaceae bacterium H3SJ34-1]